MEDDNYLILNTIYISLCMKSGTRVQTSSNFFMYRVESDIRGPWSVQREGRDFEAVKEGYRLFNF